MDWKLIHIAPGCCPECDALRAEERLTIRDLARQGTAGQRSNRLLRSQEREGRRYSREG